MFYLLIILLLISGLTSGGFSVREYKLPSLRAGARTSSLFIAFLLFLIHQRFYNNVNFKISNQIDTESTIIVDISTINVGEKELEITNRIDNFNYTSKKFNIPKSGLYYYSIEFYATDTQGQLYQGRSRVIASNE